MLTTPTRRLVLRLLIAAGLLLVYPIAAVLGPELQPGPDVVHGVGVTVSATCGSADGGVRLVRAAVAVANDASESLTLQEVVMTVYQDDEIVVSAAHKVEGATREGHQRLVVGPTETASLGDFAAALMSSLTPNRVLVSVRLRGDDTGRPYIGRAWADVVPAPMH